MRLSPPPPLEGELGYAMHVQVGCLSMFEIYAKLKTKTNMKKWFFLYLIHFDLIGVQIGKKCMHEKVRSFLFARYNSLYISLR